MQYTVTWDDNQLDFINKVEKYLQIGWKLQGGLTMTKNSENGKITFGQALYKE